MTRRSSASKGVAELTPISAARRATPHPSYQVHVLHLGAESVRLYTLGEGIPFVFVPGLGLPVTLYLPALAALASLGYKVIGVEGHWSGLDHAGRSLGSTLEVMGLDHAVLAGHSLGGRVVADVACLAPEKVLAVVAIDAGLGRPWDLLVAMARFNPLLLGSLGAALAMDTGLALSAGAPVAGRTAVGHISGTPALARRTVDPLRVAGLAASVLWAPSSVACLEELRRTGVPVALVHGEHDPVVPLAAARDAAQRSSGDLVVVGGGGHSWILATPEAFGPVMARLVDGPIGTALGAAGEPRRLRMAN